MERVSRRALAAGEVDAACMIDGNHLLFSREGTLPAGAPGSSPRPPPYDHCNMTVADTRPAEAGGPVRRAAAVDVLRRPRGAPAARPGGPAAWRAGRTSGYAQLEPAVDEAGFYDADGRVTAAEYAP